MSEANKNFNTNDYLYVFSNLCQYDERNHAGLCFTKVEGELSFYRDSDIESKNLEQQKNCACDNCHYGRTKLANIFIDYISEFTKDFEIDPNMLHTGKKKFELTGLNNMKLKVELCVKCNQPKESSIIYSGGKPIMAGCFCEVTKKIGDLEKEKPIVIIPNNGKMFEQLIGRGEVIFSPILSKK